MNKSIQTRDKSRSAWAHGGFGLYLVSLALPSVYVNGETLWGLQAAMLSMLGLGTVTEPDALEPGQTLACVSGFMGNALLLMAYLGFIAQRHLRKKRGPHHIPLLLAAAATLASVSSGTLLQIHAVEWRLYPGFFVWSMAPLLMVWATAGQGSAEAAVPDKHEECQAE